MISKLHNPTRQEPERSVNNENFSVLRKLGSDVYPNDVRSHSNQSKKSAGELFSKTTTVKLRGQFSTFFKGT